jgi:Leucine-rich repeat (LRR) protein
MDEEYKIFENPKTKFFAARKWSPDAQRSLVESGLTYLRLSGYLGWTSKDIGFLKDLKFLERLDLMAPTVKDISPLYELPNLNDLSISGTVPPIDFGKLPSLRRLALTWSIKKYESLLECTQLQHLSMTHFNQPDLMALVQLRNLEKLDLGYSNFSSLNGIQELQKLRGLGLAVINFLESLAGLEGCSLLRVFVVEKAKMLRDIVALGSLGELRTVGFADCPSLTSIRCLEGLPNLQAVNLLNTTNVADGDLSPLLSLPSLKNASIRDRRHYSHQNAELPKSREVFI